MIVWEYLLVLEGLLRLWVLKVGYPDYGISYLIEPAVKSVDEIESLKLPDPKKRMGFHLSGNYKVN